MKDDELPPELEEMLSWPPAMAAWSELPATDRQRFIAWIRAARNHKQTLHRAWLVHDRVVDGQGWASPARMLLAAQFSMPRRMPGNDADETADDSGTQD